MSVQSNSPTDPPPIRLIVEALSRRYGEDSVVSDLSLLVRAGQVTCLLGPSGCGKSTTLRMIAGVENPNSGYISIDGRTVFGGGHNLPPEARSVGLMFQDFALFPHLTVAQNVAFGLRGTRADKARRVDDLLEKVNLSGFGDKHPHALSGGEQQRVALVRALAPNPKVMLMDEPFSGLDNRLRDAIRDATLTILKEAGAAVLLVTHDPDEALRMGDEIVLMRKCKTVQKGAPYHIYNTPADRESAAFFSDINVIQGVSKGALTNTPFGAFLTPGLAEGALVDIVIRPQHLKIDFDRAGRGPNPTTQDGTPARGTVVRARFLGRESLVEFAMDGPDPLRLTALVPGVFLPKLGTPLWLMLRRDKCFVFGTKPKKT